MGTIDTLPENGLDLILGNDLVRSDEVGTPVLTKDPIPKEDTPEEKKETFL